MNEADRKAFKKWVTPICSEKDAKDDPWLIGQYRLGAERAWQAACEHKQREIDELTARVAKLEGGLRDAIRYADDCMKLLGEVNDAILKGDEDDEQPNEITIGSEAARILRKYDDVSGDSLQEAKDDQ